MKLSELMEHDQVLYKLNERLELAKSPMKQRVDAYHCDVEF